jgi:hypothetical protein
MAEKDTTLERLTRELYEVVRKAPSEPEDLEGRVPVLSGFFRVAAVPFKADAEQVHYITRHLIPDYVKRLPPGPEASAIAELFRYEDRGVPLSLTSRYNNAEACLGIRTSNFARRHEPRLLRSCARQFLILDRDDSLEAMLRQAEKGAGSALALSEPENLSPVATMLWNHTLEEQLDRLTAIQEGVVPVRDQDEMLHLFVKLTHAAESSLHAVDQTSLDRWFTDRRLRRYLEAQLHRAESGEVRVIRLRVVREVDLSEARQRNLLREFIAMHERAGAQLVLCHEDDLRGLNTSFLRGGNPEDRLILAMIDYSTRPACLVGELDEDGYVKQSVLYLRSLAQVRRYYADLQALLEDITYREAHGRGVAARLAEHDDPPLADTPPTDAPHPRWPLAAPVM